MSHRPVDGAPSHVQDGVPQHVVPSYDLTTLWVLNNGSSTPRRSTRSRAKKARPGGIDPYNMYYNPDGRLAIVSRKDTSNSISMIR